MKKIFRLSAIVAMLSMMATTATFTSCSDDDDDEEPGSEVVELDWTKATETIAVTPGMSFKAKHGEKVYSVKVVKAEAGAVTLNIDGTEVELSDAGTSFCSVDKKGMYQKEAEAAASSVLMALSPKSKNVISGTACANDIVSAGADKTRFLAD